MRGNNKNVKYVLIAMSGGADSMLLVLMNLRKGNHVSVVHFTFDLNTSGPDFYSYMRNIKTIRKGMKRENISQGMLQEITNKGILSPDKTITDPAKLVRMNVPVYGMCVSQPPMWAVLLAYASRNFRHRNGDDSKRSIDHIEVGYVLGDHGLSYLESMNNTFAILSIDFFDHFSSHIMDEMKPLPKIIAPLSKVHKDEILTLIDKHLDLTGTPRPWTCELSSRLSMISLISNTRVTRSELTERVLKSIIAAAERNEHEDVGNFIDLCMRSMELYFPCGRCRSCESVKINRVTKDQDELIEKFTTVKVTKSMGIPNTFSDFSMMDVLVDMLRSNDCVLMLPIFDEDSELMEKYPKIKILIKGNRAEKEKNDDVKKAFGLSFFYRINRI